MKPGNLALSDVMNDPMDDADGAKVPIPAAPEALRDKERGMVRPVTYPLLIRRGFSFYSVHREGSGVDRIDVALLGLGTVGTGVYKMLQSNQDVIARRTGLLFEVKHILVRNLDKQRKVDGVQPLLTTRFEEILSTGVDVVMEAMGGVEPARTYIERAIRNRCHVVTANKELIAKHGAELEKLAQEHGVQLLFEASVGGV